MLALAVIIKALVMCFVDGCLAQVASIYESSENWGNGYQRTDKQKGQTFEPPDNKLANSKDILPVSGLVIDITQRLTRLFSQFRQLPTSPDF